LRNLQRAEQPGCRVGLGTLNGIARTLGVDVATIIRAAERPLTDWEKSIGMEVLRLKKLEKTSEIASRLRPVPGKKTLEFAFEIDPAEEVGNLMATAVTLIGELRDNLTVRAPENEATHAAEQIRKMGQINNLLAKLSVEGAHIYFGSYTTREVEWDSLKRFYTVKDEHRVKVLISEIDKSQITKEIFTGITLEDAVAELKRHKADNHPIDEEWLEWGPVGF